MINSIEIFLALIACIGIILIIAAGVYDILVITRRDERQAAIRRLRFPLQPRVVVLIYAHNNEQTIEVCLKKMSKSLYRNFEIVVVNNHSHDATARMTQTFMQSHPTVPLSLYTTRHYQKYTEAIKRGYRKVRSGDFVLVVTAANSIAPGTLKTAVAQYQMNQSAGPIELGVTARFAPTIQDAATSLQSASNNVFAKVRSLLHLPTSQVGRTILYTHHALRKSGRNEYTPLRYMSDSNMQPVGNAPQTTSLFNNLISAVMFLIYFIVAGYCVFTAATHLTSSLLLFSWLGVSLWLLVAVWSNDSYSSKSKLNLFYVIPSGYILVPISLILRVLRHLFRDNFGRPSYIRL